MKSNFFLPTLLFLIILFINPVYSQEQSESDDFSYALKLYEEKFYDLAAQQFIRYGNNHPGSEKLDEAGYYAGMSLYQLGEYKDARIEFQAVAVNHPKSQKAPESWFMIGECYFNQGNSDEAAKAYEAVKTLYPNHAKAANSALKAGEQYMKVGLYEKADQLFTLIQDRYVESSSYYPSLLAHGVLNIQNNKFAIAKDKFNKILEVNADDYLKANALFQLGVLSEKKGYTGDAINFYERILNSYKNNTITEQTALNVAKLYIQNNDFVAAQTILSKTIPNVKNESQKNEINELYGDALFLNEKYALALNAYKQILQTSDTKNNRIEIKSALSWYHQKNIDKALDTLEPIFKILPDTVNNYFMLSVELYLNWLDESKKYDRAITLYNLIRSTPYYSNAIKLKIVDFLKNENKWQEIIRELKPETLNNQPFAEKDDFVYNIAYAYEQLENYTESSRYYLMLMEDYPSSKFVKNAQINLKYINDYNISDESLGVSQLALLIGDVLNSEDKGRLQFRLGKIYFENLKDYFNAIQQFENALLQPENESIKSEIFYFIGQSYLMLADVKDITSANSSSYLEKAKLNFSKAMEVLNTAENPDIVSAAFIDCAIRVETPPFEKQIKYYTTLLEKYPGSTLVENWHEKLGSIYLLDTNDEPSAKKEYEYLIANFKNSERLPIYLFVYAKILNSQNLPALDYYRKIAGEYPNSEFAAEALFNMAEIYFYQMQYKEANQLYQKLLNDYFYTYYANIAISNIGNTYLASNEYDKAIEIFEENIKGLPLKDAVLRKQNVSDEAINSIFKIGKANFLKGDMNKARENLSLFLKLSTNVLLKSEAYLLLGDTYYTIGDKQGAIDSYSHVQASDTTNYTKSLVKLSNCYFELNNYTEAINTYKILIKTPDSATPDIYSKYIISLIRSGNQKQANTEIDGFEKKFKNETNYLASFNFEQGERLRLTQNYNDAVKLFKKVQSNYKNSDYSDNAAYHEALTYITLNKQKESLEILTNFASNYPNSDQLGAVLNTLGGIYFRSEKYESAVLSFKSSLKKELTTELRKQVLSNLIKTYTYVNFWDAALALARDYINDYPDADDVIDKKITMSQAYVNLNQYDRAIELLRQARLEADSEKEPEIQFYIGDAYLKAGQYESAIAEFVKIPLLSRKTKLQWEASALFYSGQAYEKLGRTNEAVRMYQEIIDRPGIDLILKKDAKKRIEQIKG